MFPVASIPVRTVAVARAAILVTWLLILATNVPVWVAHTTHRVNNGQWVRTDHVDNISTVCTAPIFYSLALK